MVKCGKELTRIVHIGPILFAFILYKQFVVQVYKYLGLIMLYVV